MKTKFLLPILLMFLTFTGFSKTWTITNSGTTFSPESITINVGDSVKFSISSSHNSVEVSQSTWNANGKTPLPGFSTPFGGGLVLPAQLAVGTHYFVCTPHASLGMKGTIIVQNTTGNAEMNQNSNIKIYPNPSNGLVHIAMGDLKSVKSGNLQVFNLHGEKVYGTVITSSILNIDLSNSSNGIYFLKIFDGNKSQTKRIIKN